MGAVQLNGFDADLLRPLGSADKVFQDAVQGRWADGLWGGFARGDGHRRRGLGPPTAFALGDQLATVPGHMARALATRVTDLDRHRHRRGQAAGPAQHIGQGLGCGVVVQTQAARRDATAFRNGRGLDGEQTGAAVEQIAPVHQVPVAGQPVDARILAHGGHHNAVGQFEGPAAGAEFEFAEKCAHKSLHRVSWSDASLN